MDVNQIEMVGEKHPFRKLMASLNFKEIQESVQIKKTFVGATEYGKDSLILCLTSIHGGFIRS